MITESTLYWITRLDNFQNLLVILGLLALAGIFFPLIALTQDYITEVEEKISKTVLSISIPVFIVSAIGLVFLPSTKEMCAIKVIPAIMQNEKIEGIGEKALNLTEAWIDELMPSKKK